MAGVNGVEFHAKRKDGTGVLIVKDKTHYRAYNAAGVEVGKPFMEMGNLLKDLDAVLDGEQNKGTDGQPPVRPGQEGKKAAEPGQEANDSGTGVGTQNT